MKEYVHFLKSNWLLIAIITFAIILRFYRLSEIPISLNHDETAIGYNAYSIFRTGADEYGKFLPLSLKSFGDWKLPLYPLVDIPFIIIFGLNAVAVRLPSAIAGASLVYLIYQLSYQFFQKKKLALLASLLMAISPWGIFFSRISYEANLATSMLALAAIFFSKYYYQKKSSFFLVPTALLLGLTIFTYHAFVLFAPLFAISLALLVLTAKRTEIKKWKYLSLSIMIFFIGLSVYSTLSSGSINKLSSTSLFDDKHMINERVDIIRGDKANESEIGKKVLHNKYTAVAYQILQNYTLSYSPTFLFDKGGEKFLHNIGNFGNFYLIDALFLIVGLVAIAYNREKRIVVLFLWFVLGPIPSAITTDAPSSTRLFLMLPAFILVSSYGFYALFIFFTKYSKVGLLIKIILLISLLTNFIYFLDAYYIHMNYHRAQFFHYGYKEVVELTNKYPNFKVVMYDPTNFPYISFLFYNRYDPQRFRKEVKYYPSNFGPFYYVKSFGRYNFVDTIDYEHLEKNTIYIDYRGIRDEDYKIIDPSGQPVFKYFFRE